MKNNKKVADSPTEAINILWEEGYFKDWVDCNMVAVHLGDRGNNFLKGALSMALTRSKLLTPRKNGKAFEYIQMKPATSRKVEAIESQLFDPALVRQLGKNFEQEIEDLHLNFGRSGTCTVFLLRKILEKLIYIVFAGNNLESKLTNSGASGRLIGLNGMIDVATREKIKGIPFLTSKTAKEIRGIKFLGDTSAHNPLVNVDMKTILPQMPFIITAYKELAKRL